MNGRNGGAKEHYRNISELFLNQARAIMTSQEFGSPEEEVQGAMKALALLMNSVRLSHGDEAAEELLRKGRRMFHDEGTDQDRDDVLAMLETGASLLLEQDDEYGSALLREAFTNGSSVMCRRCNGLVSRERWDAHVTQWCPKLSNNNEHYYDDDFEEDHHMDDVEEE